MDIQAFVQIVGFSCCQPQRGYGQKADGCQFFETFKEYEGRDFHMAGESYGVSNLLATGYNRQRTAAEVIGALPARLRLRST